MTGTGGIRKKSSSTTVLIVDDSALARTVLSDIINGERGLEVIGVAKDGEEALKKIEELDPDVVTLDLLMPGVDGLAALQQIMDMNPRPVIIVSAYAQEGAEQTLEALEFGAVDFIPKPSVLPTTVVEVKDEIISKVRAAAASRARELIYGHAEPRLRPKVKFRGEVRERDKVVIIGASAGGPRALAELLPRFPLGLPANWVVVQHMPPSFTGMLAKRLDAASDIKVIEAHDGSFLLRNRVLLAPGGRDLVLEKEIKKRRRIHIVDTVAHRGASPVIDITMESAARAFGDMCIGVLLSGMGTDGAMGLGAIKDAGGVTIAQDESSSMIYGMQRTAVEKEYVDFVVPLGKIADTIVDQL